MNAIKPPPHDPYVSPRTKVGDPPTQAQARVLEYMIAYQAVHFAPPTFREVSEALGWQSPNSSKGHMERLAAKGLVTRIRGEGSSRRFVPTSLLPPKPTD